MNKHTITIVVPARIFESSAFLPFLRQHSHTTVDEACHILEYTAGSAVPGKQKYHICTFITNQRASIHPDKKAAVSVTHADFMDLLCTMPTSIHGHFTKALVDTAANHSMITRTFLNRHDIAYTPQHSVTIGISATEASCLGTVTLDTRVGRNIISVTYTVVDSLPCAAADFQPNEALFALDVISAVDMHIKFKHPHILITIPPPKPHRGKKGRIWLHAIHKSTNKFTTETSTMDEFFTSARELKAMTSSKRATKYPVYVAHIKPTIESIRTSCASARRKGYLSQQVAPAHQPQAPDTIPKQIQAIIDKHSHEGGTLGPAPPNTSASGFEMDIDLLPGTRPKAARQYRLTPIEQLELEKQLQHLIDMGWVQPSISPWASCVLFAPKPGGKLRLCIDYRYLNENTIKNTYPLPRIDTLLDKLRGHKFFSALDLQSGYHQIKLSESAGPKTAFRTPDGLYQWTVMPFGLSNAPSVFQQAVHVVLKGLIGKICLAYLDDIIVLAPSEKDHAKNLDVVLTRLSEHRFFCNTTKCQFALQEIKYLGHVVTADTVKPDPYKVSVLKDWPLEDLQKSPNNIRSFLGLAGYFRRFIPKFPTLAGPLLQRICAKEQHPWTVHHTQSFENIKHALINATIMRHPDPNRPFHMYTDASDYAYGAVLTQEYEGKLAPIAWVGRKLNKSEENYYTLEKELGAIVFAYRQWRCYLENNQTVFIHSDHNPLRFLQTQKKLTGKHARWLESLSRIDWKITYIPGDKNVVADAVSRATHLPNTEVTLHDGMTLCAEHPQQPYRALALTNLLVRRPLTPTDFPPLPTSSESSSGTSRATHRQTSQQACQSTGTMGSMPLHMVGQPARPTPAASADNILPAIFTSGRRSILPQTLGLPPGLPEVQPPQSSPTAPSHPPSTPPPGLQLPLRSSPPTSQPRAKHTQTPPPPELPQQQQLSPKPSYHQHTSPKEVLPPPPAHPGKNLQQQPQPRQPPQQLPPPPLPPPPSTIRNAPPKAATSALESLPAEKSPPLSEEPTPEQPEGMVIDQETFAEIGANLHDQHNKHLTLDTVIDDFWERLRTGYAHDPAFRNPSPKFRFDKHFQAYFLDHKLVVPDHDALRKQILLWHHVHPWHAHLGIHRTQALIMDTFHWDNISDDIAAFVTQCHSCQLMKSPGCSDSTLSPLPIPTACWRVVSLDMITQLPRTTSGFDCITVFVDQFSKMVRLIPTVNTLDGPGFAKLFFTHIYPHYGLPLGICSDRGAQWNNKFFKSICSHMGIDLRLTFSYHPRANGQVERLNRVIEEALRHFVSPAHDDWDTFLPHVEFSINSAKNASTGCTPFQLNRITPPLSPTALAFSLPESRKLHTSVLHRMYYHLAKQALSEAKQSMWSGPLNSKPSPQFAVGKPVLLSISKLALHHPSLRRKFTARWVGPCTILELVGTRAAKLQLPATLRALKIHNVFHFSCLKPYIDAHYHECTAAPQPNASMDADKVFEVESVMDYRRTHRATATTARAGPHYLVRWKGYSAQHDMWLPVGELGNCLDKVAGYLFQHASSKERDIMIDQFPKRARLQLTHLVQRAERTTHRDTNTCESPSRPPRLHTKTRRKSQRISNMPPKHAAVARFRYCSACAAYLH